MSKTAVVTSGDVNVRVASHFSKVPPIATDAFTKNLIELYSGVTTNSGTCALPSDGRAIDVTRQRTFNPSITPLNPNRSDSHRISRHRDRAGTMMRHTIGPRNSFLFLNSG